MGWVRKGPRVDISTITALYVNTMPTRLSALTENSIPSCSNLSAKSFVKYLDSYVTLKGLVDPKMKILSFCQTCKTFVHLQNTN